MKRLICLAAVATFTCGIALGSALASDAPAASAVQPPAEPLRVTNYGTKAPVTFDHARHAELDCARCHHRQDEGAYKCGDCHGAKTTDQAPRIKDAMHKKEAGACYACHFGAEPEAKKLKCGECHVKR